MADSWQVGVASWSLEPRGADDLVTRVLDTGARVVQLALDPIRLGVMGIEEVRRRFRDGGLRIASGMMAMEGEDYSTIASIRRTGGVVPDATWRGNLAAARELADIAGELGLGLVTFHAGALSGDPRRVALVQRLRGLAEIYGARGARVALETGQEPAPVLEGILHELEPGGVGVNFDPANMILYGSGDPVTALSALAGRVLQVHIKDALPAAHPDAWGDEVPVGKGAVDWASFVDALRRCRSVETLVIERESGADRLADIIGAREFLERMLR